MLRTSHATLREEYDVALLDLDGVVYVGPSAVPGAPGHLAEARAAGMRLAYVTNNASRPPSTVAQHLRELGIEVEDQDVVSSAQAAARLLAERLPAGAAVFVIGGEGLRVALTEQGLGPVQQRSDQPAAVVSGFAAELTWSTVITGAILVREGLPWVASNTDLTVPTPHGPGPGNGALVDVVARFAQRTPQVAGKPEPPLFQETLRRVQGRRPLVVGDRIDTDIEGAHRAGLDSLLVMTGVTDLAQLVAVPADLRPSYVGADLGTLARAQHEPETLGDTVRADGWCASVREGALVVWRTEGRGDQEEDGADSRDSTDSTSAAAADVDAWWRAVATAGWRHLDAHGSAADVSGLQVPSSVGGSEEDASDEQTAG